MQLSARRLQWPIPAVRGRPGPLMVGGRHGRRFAATSPRLDQVICQIDALNSQDPRTATVDGQQVPYELAYSRWVTDWVLKLQPNPSDECLIVAR